MKLVVLFIIGIASPLAALGNDQDCNSSPPIDTETKAGCSAEPCLLVQ